MISKTKSLYFPQTAKIKHVTWSETLAVFAVFIVWCVQSVLEGLTEMSWKSLQENVRPVLRDQ